MRPPFLSLVLVLLLLIFATANGGDQQLPKDAEQLVKEFDQEADAIEQKATAEIKARQHKLVERLQFLRDNHVKGGNLDDALEIHQLIKQLKVAHVEVEWGGNWWPAEILETKDDTYLIHYANHTDASNEWVTKDRLRHPYHRRPTLKAEKKLNRRLHIVP